MNKQTKEKSKQVNSENKVENKIDSIFKRVSKDDLQIFLKAQFSRDQNFKSTFIANFVDLLDENPVEKYSSIVSNLYKAAQNRNGWVDYRNARHLGNSLIKLTDKASDCLEQNKISESITICKTLIENVSVFFNEVDDSSGLLSEVIHISFRILQEVISKCPPMMKDELYEYCIAEYKKQKYKGIVDENFLDILPKLITTDEQERIFFEVLDQSLSQEIDKEYGDYYSLRLISAKVDYYLSKKMKAEADKIIKENITIPEFRNIVVDECIAKKDFVTAKKLSYEGIMISEKKNHPGTTNDWKRKLLHISQLEKNIPDTRKWSEELFFRSLFDITFYRILKSTFPDNSSEWIEECERILRKLESTKDIRRYAYTEGAARIFVEEKYTDRLLALIRNNQKDINFVDNYAVNIKHVYPEELIIIFSNAIKSYAETPDKRTYLNVARFIKKLSEIKGSENEIRKLLIFLRGIYRNRKTMMKILDDNFPQC